MNWLLRFLLIIACADSRAASLTSFVNPFIGTGAVNTGSAPTGGKGGATQPGAVAPFGMIQLGPDSLHPETSGYSYADTFIKHFSLTHLSGPGCSNGGELPFLPFVGNVEWAPKEFEHSHESSSPGYYQVRFNDGINVELTATDRTGMARFEFPASPYAGLLFNVTANNQGATLGELKFAGKSHFSGWTDSGNFCEATNRYKIYFAVEFDRPAGSITQNNGLTEIRFPAASPLLMKVGISYVSEKNAKLNLSSENPGWSFPHTLANARAAWEQALVKIKVVGTTRDKTIFYTALYHSLLHPNISGDVNGEYLGFDGKLHSSGKRVHYANFSGWDIYRSQVQLLALLFSERASEIAQSLVDSAEQCGALPKWAFNNDETGIMVGDPGPIILANLFAFGATDFTKDKALKLMKVNAFDAAAACNGHLVRDGLGEYSQRGYLTPASKARGSASVTLEYASSDFAISKFAEALGDTNTSKLLLQRSGTWKKLWDPEHRHIRSRQIDGNWLSPFDPASEDGFVEGNSAQYSWMVPFNMGQLVQFMGPDIRQRLDSFFVSTNSGLDQPNFYIGNEPGFATPWAYLWAGLPSRTQAVVRKTLRDSFTDSPGGLPGNDDLGATSSWYVWSALGFYPAIPGVGGLAVHSPLFSQADIRVSHGLFSIRAHSANKNFFVRKLKFNGKPINRAWLPWAMVRRGGVLNFDLDEKPSAWATRAEDRPPSYSFDMDPSIQ